MITEILDHVDQAKARLIQQYKNKPRIGAIIEAFIEEIQEIESMFKDLNLNRSLETATGNTLDRLGDIVGVARSPGQSDSEYRISIKAKISQNISQGEPERLISTFQLLKGAALVLLQENYPAAIHIGTPVPIADQDEANMLMEIMERTAAAGVRIEGLISFDPGEPFAFDGALPGFGFGDDTNPLAGGKLAFLWEPTIDFAFDGDDPNAGGFGHIQDSLVGGVLT